MQLRRLGPTDAHDYRALRLHALQESPADFCASHADEAWRSIDEVALRLAPTADGSPVTLGAFEGVQLRGFVAVTRPSRDKLRHTAELSGLYVAPDAWRRGIARALLRIAVDHAFALDGVRQVRLGVNAANSAARGLYEAAGFACYGVEPASMCIAGGRVRPGVVHAAPAGSVRRDACARAGWPARVGG